MHVANHFVSFCKPLCGLCGQDLHTLALNVCMFVYHITITIHVHQCAAALARDASQSTQHGGPASFELCTSHTPTESARTFPHLHVVRRCCCAGARDSTVFLAPETLCVQCMCIAGFPATPRKLFAAWTDPPSHVAPCGVGRNNLVSCAVYMQACTRKAFPCGTSMSPTEALPRWSPQVAQVHVAAALRVGRGQHRAFKI